MKIFCYVSSKILTYSLWAFPSRLLQLLAVLHRTVWTGHRMFCVTCHHNRIFLNRSRRYWNFQSEKAESTVFLNQWDLTVAWFECDVSKIIINSVRLLSHEHSWRHLVKSWSCGCVETARGKSALRISYIGNTSCSLMPHFNHISANRTRPILFYLIIAIKHPIKLLQSWQFLQYPFKINIIITCM
jgi:hypothetical protein